MPEPPPDPTPAVPETPPPRRSPKTELAHLELDDPKAWDRLYEAINPAGLLIYAEDLIGPRIQSALGPEDVLNTVLTDLWERRHSLRWRGPREFRSLVMIHIQRRVLDEARQSQTRKRSGDDPAADQDQRAAPARAASAMRTCTTTTPSRIAWLRERAAAIRAAIDSLPEELRTILRLRVVEQLPVHQVSRLVNRSPETVRAEMVIGAKLYAEALRSRLGSRAGA